MKKYLSPLLFGIGCLFIVFAPLLNNIFAFFAVDTLGEVLCHRKTENSDTE